ncbi:MAG: ABC transporter ATP-binding protein/permease [Bacteroidia bacterium]|nr:ABC transporter ATP-binding protein/permease [Bacteroidia bacterium]
MNQTPQLINILDEFAKASNHQVDLVALQKSKIRFQNPALNNFTLFIEQLNNVGSFTNFVFEARVCGKTEFEKITNKITFPILYFKTNKTELVPVLLKHFEKKQYETIEFHDKENIEVNYNSIVELSESAKSISNLVLDNNLVIEKFDIPQSTEEQIIYITGIHIGSILNYDNKEKTSPFNRLLSLLKTEKKDIKYIYFFAVLIAIINLALPLGVQSIVGLISGGLILESVIILIAMVIIATGLSGYLQIQQLKMVEILLQRVFANVTFEFAWRLPKIKSEILLKNYTPDMVNRFFDVLTIQKALPKILIDFTAAIIQISFGLLLLSLYHPVFIGFGIVLIFIIIIIFYSTGKKALKTSISESKYKYKVAYWLQEIGRNINAFKLSGNSNLPIQKADHLLSNYINYRNKHFKILLKQYASIVSFKTLITASLLILGSFLVVNRQINLGQFVAAELIIVLIINSVEKLISTLEVFYDLLTAFDKIGQVTDLETESNVGRELHDLEIEYKFQLKTTELSYKYPDAKNYILNNINFEINKGEHFCLTGFGDSGKTTLIKILAGLYSNYEGAILFNDVSLRDLNIESYRNIIGDNLLQDEIFEGTIEENIMMGRNGIEFKEVIKVLKIVGLTDFIAQLTDGLQSNLLSAGTNYPKSIIQKILLARSLVQKPKLLIIDDFFYNINQKENATLLDYIFGNKDWALIMVSSQASIMKRCDKVFIMNNGNIIESGIYNELLASNSLNNFLS